MRHLFPGHYLPSSESFSTLWREGLVVPDANVLLDLYRYPEATSLEVLAAFEKITPRLWIPHQVALEYHWNRDLVISEQEGRYDKTISALNDLLEKVKGEIVDKRHAFIDGDHILATFAAARDYCVAKIKEASKKQLSIGGGDHITKTLERLFDGKIGPAPNEAELKKLHEEGERRFARKQPPGYLDEKKKGKKSDLESDVHLHKGLEHKRKFGDWIYWSQILDNASKKSLKHIILITGETGEDWWQYVGHKKVGPRPELVEEIHGQGVELFHMYDLKRFLEYAKKNLSAAVSTESLERVQEVYDLRTVNRAERRTHWRTPISRWLRTRFPESPIRWVQGDKALVDMKGNKILCRIFDGTGDRFLDNLPFWLQGDRRVARFRRMYIFGLSSSDECEQMFSAIRDLVRGNAPINSEMHVGWLSQGEYVNVASDISQPTVPA